jgi:kynurenine 3-monooxygenase
MMRGRAQDKAILNMIADGELNVNGDLKEVLKKVQKATNEILNDDKVARTMQQ